MPSVKSETELDNIIVQKGMMTISLESNQFILGLAGQLGTGKTTIANYIANKYDFKIFEFGGLFRKLLSSQGKRITRKNLQDLGQNLITEIGPYGISELLCHEMTESHRCIVDGVRHLGVVDYFRHCYGACFKLIFITASIETRLLRIKQRRKFETDKRITIEKLNKIERHLAEQEVQDISILSDYVQNTDKPFDIVCQELDELLTNYWCL